MLIPCLFSCLSIFIPFNLKPTSSADISSFVKINGVIPYLNFTVLFIGDLDNPETEKYKDIFLRASAIFHKEGAFFCLDSSKSSDILLKFGQKPPCLIFYKKSVEWLVVPFPRKEESLLFLLDHFFSQKLIVANNEADVLSYLGHSNFAVLTPPDLSDQVLSIRPQISLYIGSFDIIVCDEKLLKRKFQVNKGEIGIYRLEDRTIKSIPPSPDDIFKGSIPSFRRFVTSDFREPNSTFLAFIGINPIDDNFTSINNEIDDLLYDLSIQFPQFIIGYLEPRLHYIARHATLQKLNKLPTMIAFSAYDRSYFPYNDTNLFKLPFSKNAWLKDAKSYLTQILKGKIERKYHSEPVPVKDDSDPVEIIVGNTYDSFMKDKKHDLYVMFIESNGALCNDALAEFRKAAKVAKDIRFAVIDAYLNSSPRGFPHIALLPYVRFYPSKNHSNNMPFLNFMNRNNFLRFAMKFGSKNYKFDVPKKTLYEVRAEMSQFNKIVGRLPIEDREKTEKYFKELALETQSQSQASKNNEL